jgi:chromosome segregation ATPase
MWATIWETAKYLLPLLGAGAAWWVRDRRKDAAAAEVAERTVPADVAVKEAGADEARLVYVQREMDVERSFHRQQLADRDAEIARQRAELGHRDQIIARLRDQIEELQARLDGATRQLNSVRDQLDELVEHHPPHDQEPQ